MDLKNKNVLITGADGFIGSHLTERLILEGCKVKAFVYYNSFGSWGWLDNLPKETLDRIEVINGDVRDTYQVRKAADGSDVVFHLAALISIPYSYHAPESYVDTNIKGTLNVLEACRQSNCEKILITSTSEVYGTAKYVPIDELHPFQGQSPYSASKIAADRLAESFYRSFDLPVSIVRPFNTFGPRQSARAIIPTIILQLLEGAKQIKLGNLHPTRDLVYVKDTVSGFIEIAKSDLVKGEEINIATQKEISMGDLAALLIKIMDSKAEVTLENSRIRPEKSEVERLLGSNKKLSSLTAWRQEYSLEEGLKETIDWFSSLKNSQVYKSGIYNY